MSELRCRHCGAAARLFLRTKDYNRAIAEQVFDYYKCAACHLIFLAPIPSDLGSYYEGYHSRPASLSDLEAAAKHERYKLDLIQRFVPAGQLLEIGPAHGTFAYLAKKAGYEVSTIELDAECCRFLRDVVGVSAIQSDSPGNALEQGKDFDAIVMWHVAEHLEDPLEVLRIAAKHLRPNGILVIAMPNPDSIQFRLFGSRWAHLDAPRHLTLVPANLVERAMETEGLESILITTTDAGGLGWNRFGWQQSLRHILPRAWSGVSRLLGRGLTLLARVVERKGMSGTTYTAIFRRA